MKVGKPKSKRTPVRLRHKIEKASAAKQRKSRKEAKKNPQWRSKLKKDPGIPNLFPYKDRLLSEIEETRRQKAEDGQRRREESKRLKNGAVAGEDNVNLDADAEFAEQDQDEEDEDMEAGEEESSNPMAALVASARARASKFDRANGNDLMEESEEDMDEDEESDGMDDTFITARTGSVERDSGVREDPALQKTDLSRKQHDKSFRSVISASDVILYVLDARDPISTRSKVVEQTIMANPDKRLILVLNKIDLVPHSVLKAWLLQLRRSFPTLPLRCSSSNSSAGRNFDHKQLTPQFTANNLIRALKSYSTSKNLKRSITVGIVGYPNVGKSSVVNALTSRLGGRRPSHRSTQQCPVGAEAGITTVLREVKLDNKIKLIDSPGIVFPSASQSNSTSEVEKQADLILLNAIPPKEITDPMPAISLLLQRLSRSAQLREQLLATYSMPALMGGSDVTTDFLLHVARKRGRLGKGGVPNLHAAALTVLSDWRDGRIQGWVEPADEETKTPATDGGVQGRATQAAAGADEKKIVTQWAAEFKIEGLWGDGGGDETAVDRQIEEEVMESMDVEK